jgi:membrane associated rhomboid family serine protease
MRISLKILIIATLSISLAAGVFPELYQWLSLSWSGIKNYYLWQLLTYVFLEKGPISLSFFIQLGFNMYILWMFGSSLIERFHPRIFFFLYLGSAIASGLAAIIFPNAVLAGSTNAVYAILIAWMILNHGSQLLLFFTLPFKSQWLILGLVGLSLLGSLSSSNWADALGLIVSVLYGYLFTLIVFRQQSSFSFLSPFERKILRLLERKKIEPYHHSKIYDIKSGAPVLDDDQFMDAMLDRISRHGAESLTAAEKKRMKQISEKRK